MHLQRAMTPLPTDPQHAFAAGHAAEAADALDYFHAVAEVRALIYA